MSFFAAAVFSGKAGQSERSTGGHRNKRGSAASAVESRCAAYVPASKVSPGRLSVTVHVKGRGRQGKVRKTARGKRDGQPGLFLPPRRAGVQPDRVAALAKARRGPKLPPQRIEALFRSTIRREEFGPGEFTYPFFVSINCRMTDLHFGPTQQSPYAFPERAKHIGRHFLTYGYSSDHP